MSSNTVNFTINLNGNAYDGFLNLDRAIDDVIGSSKEVTSALNRIGRESFNFDSISNVVSKVSQAFGQLVGSSLDFEQQQANIKTLLNGDAEATEKLVGQIKEYSKATTYDTSSLVDAQKTMMSFGLDADYAFGKLKNIGDIALGDGQKMQSLALAFSQMSSTGKLMGQDLNQMINAGFNPLEVISQKTGKSIGELKEEMGKGAISAEDVAQAFEWATEEGGRFHDGAAGAADTTSGKIAKMNKTIDDLKIKLFEATGGATAWIAELGNMAVPISQSLPLLRGLKNGILKLPLAANVAAKGIGAAIKSIPLVGWVVAAVAAVIGVITILWNKCEGFRRLVMGVWESIKAILHNVGVVVQNIWNALKSFIDGTRNLFSSIYLIIKKDIDDIVEFFTNLWDKITGFVSASIAFISEKLSAVAGWLKSHLIEPIGKAFTALWDMVRNIFDKILTKLGKLFEPIRTLWNKLFPKDQMKSIALSYELGAHKGSESFRKSGKDKSNKSVLVDEDPDPEPVVEGNGKLGAGNLGKSSGESAGKAQQISIKLENMVGTMNFNGTLSDNQASVERTLTEMMARILGMAETAM